ncbi:MAG TPA: protein-disulfide reductase DsbD domain-containing protein [Thermoanaerobaculia bacterium]|nr:protein-disulfide reductase DsbD domain-containing protein [Thermoanaerobaculia bacterium]
MRRDRPGRLGRAGVILGVLAALASFGGAATGPWVANDQARVRLVAGLDRAEAGGDPALGVEFVLAPGWHVYWKNAGDAGYPPELVPAADGALAAATLRYPAPHRYELPGDLVAFGYEDRVIYPLDARLRAGLPAGPVSLAARIDYLVCAESCIPYAADLTLDLEIGSPLEDADTAAALRDWRARLPVEAGSAGAPSAETRLTTSSTGGGLELVVELSGQGLSAAAPDIFFEPHPSVSFGRPRFVASAAGPGFRVAVEPVDRTKPLPDPLAVAWTATGFETAGDAPLAVEDRVELARPAAAAEERRPAPFVALGAVAFAFLVLFLIRRFGGGRPAPASHPST